MTMTTEYQPFSVFGFAFTSPVVLAEGISKKLFRTFIFDGKLTSIQQFITPDKIDPQGRKLLVILKNLKAFNTAKNLQGVHAFLALDVPEVLDAAQNVTVLDCVQTKTADRRWKMIRFTPDTLNEALLEIPSGKVTVVNETHVSLSKNLQQGAGIRELTERAMNNLSKKEAATVFMEVCLFGLRLQGRRRWKSKGVSILRERASSMEGLIELERYLENSTECIHLWKAYWDTCKGMDLQEACAKYPKCNWKDLQWVCEIVPPTAKTKFFKNPNDK